MIRLLVICLIAAFTGRAVAGAPWTLTTTDFKAESVDVQSMTASGLQFTNSTGQLESLPLARFLQIRRNGAAPEKISKFILSLTDGDKFAGWPVEMTQDHLNWHSPSLVEISIPLRQLSSIRRSADTEANPGGTEDVVHLSNGDIVHGVVTAISGQALSVQTENATPRVPLDSVARVDFASVAQPATQPTAGLRILLNDHSELTVPAISMTAATASFEFLSHEYHINKDQIISIEQINGPVIFLSARAPIENIQIPFLGQSWPGKMDRNFDGTAVPHAISVRAYSRLIWSMPKGYAKFRTGYAVPAGLPLADITVRIKLDGKTVYENSHVRTGAQSGPITIPTNNATKITLEVDTADPYHAQGELTWISPALVK